MYVSDITPDAPRVLAVRPVCRRCTVILAATTLEKEKLNMTTPVLRRCRRTLLTSVVDHPRDAATQIMQSSTKCDNLHQTVSLLLFGGHQMLAKHFVRAVGMLVAGSHAVLSIGGIPHRGQKFYRRLLPSL